MLSAPEAVFFEKLKALCRAYNVSITAEELRDGSPELLFTFEDFGNRVSSDREFHLMNLEEVT